MLSNTDYADKFFYSPISERTEAAPSDYVDSIIYLGEERMDSSKKKMDDSLKKTITQNL